MSEDDAKRATIRHRLVLDTPADLARSIRWIASSMRQIGGGEQANDLEEIATKVEGLALPRLQEKLADLRHPLAWPTRDFALWLAERLTTGTEIVRSLIPDAEITGSAEAIARARAWLKTIEER